MRAIHNAVEAAKQEDSGETRVVDRPCPSVNAGLKQSAKMIYDDVVDETLPRGRVFVRIEGKR